MTPEGFGIFKRLIAASAENPRSQCPRCHGDGIEDHDDNPCSLCGGECWVDPVEAEAYCEQERATYLSGPEL